MIFEPTITQTAFYIAVFYFAPFLVSILLPAWLIPTLVKLTINRSKTHLPSTKIFTISLITGAIIANIIWELAIFNHLYYEWDRLFLAVTFFSHESPVLDRSSSWIATGIQTWHLTTIWFLILTLIYIISAIIAYKKNSQHPKIHTYKKILITSVLSLLVTSAITNFTLPFISQVLFEQFQPQLAYKQYDEPCKPLDHSPLISYSGQNSEWLSNLSGQNLRPAFSKHLQMNYNPSRFSPNNMMAFATAGPELWIFCTNSTGAFKIDLPPLEKDQLSMNNNYTPSWSPDSSQLVLNYLGDLVIVSIHDRSSKTIKNDISIRDYQVDITAKDKPQSMPFEYGEAI